MKCVKPYLTAAHAFPCGQCQPCRAKRRRVWAHRILLESLCHARSSFVTLTYDEDHIPGAHSLRPLDLTNWLKRFRKAVYPERVRYFGVGEYGDITQRPHYHIALFGHGCELAPFYSGGCTCVTCSVVRKTWGFGHILVASLTERSARYIAGYVVKSMTWPTDTRLQGRYPEFARMSLWPGIGAPAMEIAAAEFLKWNDHRLLRDVPTVLRHNKNLLPLGRYLRQQMRKKAGRDAKAPVQLVSDQQAALQVLRSFAWNSGRSVSSVFQELNPVRPYQDRGTL